MRGKRRALRILSALTRLLRLAPFATTLTLKSAANTERLNSSPEASTFRYYTNVALSQLGSPRACPQSGREDDTRRAILLSAAQSGLQALARLHSAAKASEETLVASVAQDGNSVERPVFEHRPDVRGMHNLSGPQQPEVSERRGHPLCPHILHKPQVALRAQVPKA